MTAKWKIDRDRNIAFHVNQETRRRQAVVSEEKNNLPRRVMMARAYSSYGNSLEDTGRRYHHKLGHAGVKVISNTLNGASIPHRPMKELCDACGTNKVKSHAHLKGTFSKENYGPGQSIVCDTIGPLSASIGGGKYWMFLKDRLSKYYLTYVVTQKSDIPACVIMGLRRFKTLSGSIARRIQMDGDGAYTSADLKAKIEEMGTLPSWSSPYDHPQNGCAENSVHSQWESACVAMQVAGVPANIWPESVGYVQFTSNNLRSVKDGDGIWVTPSMLLQSLETAFPPERMMPFGCKVIVQIPAEQREGRKSLLQPRAWIGVFVGYGAPYGYGGAYRIFDPAKGVVRTASINYCVCDEGNFPMKMNKDLQHLRVAAPLAPTLTKEALLDPNELANYDLTADEIYEQAMSIDDGPSPEEVSRTLALMPIEAVGREDISPVVPPSLETPVATDYSSGDAQTLETFPVPTLEALDPVLDRGEHSEEKGESKRGATSSLFKPHFTPLRRSERLKDNPSTSQLLERPPPKVKASQSGANVVRAPRPEEYAITAVLDRKTVDGHILYQVQWDNGETNWLDKKPLHGLGQVARDWIQDMDARLDDAQDNGPMALYCYIQDPVIEGRSGSDGNARLHSLLALANSQEQAPRDKGQEPMAFIHKRPGSPVPRGRHEAMKSNYWPDYLAAEMVEMETHRLNQTWTLVRRCDVPAGAKIMYTKWVYADKVEINSIGVPYVSKVKARLMADGSSQRPGIDYFDTFASVMRGQSFRVLLVIRLMHPDHEMEKWDAKAAFINAPFTQGEDLYIRQPKGHEETEDIQDNDTGGKQEWVCKLNKALYGAKQASNAWQAYLKKLFVRAGFAPYLKDDSVYFAWTSCFQGFCIVGTHVDDMFPTYNKKGKPLRDRLWGILTKGMELKHEGDASWALKTRIQYDRGAGIMKISQEAYTEEMLVRFGCVNVKTSTTPAYDQGPMSEMLEEDFPATEALLDVTMKKYPFKEAVGCCWWLVTISRVDILPATHKASRYLSRPSEKLWKWLMKILRYLRGTTGLGLVYTRPAIKQSGDGSERDPLRFIPDIDLLTGAADSSYADAERKKTTLGHCIHMMGNLIHYSMKTGTRNFDSSTDAECGSLVLFSHANSWLRDWLKEIGFFTVNKPTTVLEDNTSTIALSGHGSAKRSRHFDIAFFKLHDEILFGSMKLKETRTDDNHADFLTKSLGSEKFILFRDILMGGEEGQNYFNTTSTPEQHQPIVLMAHTSPQPACAGLPDDGQGLDGTGDQPVRDDRGPAAGKAGVPVASVTSGGHVPAGDDVQPLNGHSGAEGGEIKGPPPDSIRTIPGTLPECQIMITDLRNQQHQFGVALLDVQHQITGLTIVVNGLYERLGLMESTHGLLALSGRTLTEVVHLSEKIDSLLPSFIAKSGNSGSEPGSSKMASGDRVQSLPGQHSTEVPTQDLSTVGGVGVSAVIPCQTPTSTPDGEGDECKKPRTREEKAQSFPKEAEYMVLQSQEDKEFYNQHQAPEFPQKRESKIQRGPLRETCNVEGLLYEECFEDKKKKNQVLDTRLIKQAFVAMSSYPGHFVFLLRGNKLWERLHLITCEGAMVSEAANAKGKELTICELEKFMGRKQGRGDSYSQLQVVALDEFKLLALRLLEDLATTKDCTCCTKMRTTLELYRDLWDVTEVGEVYPRLKMMVTKEIAAVMKQYGLDHQGEMISSYGPENVIVANLTKKDSDTSPFSDQWWKKPAGGKRKAEGACTPRKKREVATKIEKVIVKSEEESSSSESSSDTESGSEEGDSDEESLAARIKIARDEVGVSIKLGTKDGGSNGRLSPVY
jgi:hypothetical protein